MDEKKYIETFSQLHSSVNEEELLMKTKGSKKHKFLTLPLVAILVLVLGAGAAFGTAYLHSLQDTVMDEDTVIQDPLTGDVKNADVISLQGVKGSPEYEAAKEWYEFTEGYDTDEKILDQVGNDPTPWDEKYGAYLVYSQEMADKLDEICEKYDLKLHKEIPKLADVWEIEELFGNVTSDDDATGYYYEDGTFHLESIYYELDGFYPMEYQFRRTKKGILDEVFLSIPNTDKYDQWEYETAGGETVLLVKMPTKGLIIYENEDSFVVANVNPSIEIDDEGLSREEIFELAAKEAEEKMTKEALEAMADDFDYTFGSSTASDDNDTKPAAEETTELTEDEIAELEARIADQYLEELKKASDERVSNGEEGAELIDYRVESVHVLSNEEKQNIIDNSDYSPNDILATVTYSVKPKDLESAWHAGNGSIEGEWIIDKQACICIKEGSYRVGGLGGTGF